MTQLKLFDKRNNAHARNRDPGTSKAAARSMNGGKAATLESLALMAIVENGGRAIADEIESLSGVSWRSITPRLCGLRRKGLIRDSGEKRPGASGRNQIVWEATQNGVGEA